MVRKQQDKFDKLHKQNIAKYGRMIDAIYNEAIREAVAISGMVSSVKGDTIFSFSDYPLTHKRVDKLFQRLQSNLLTAIVNGVDAEWTLANNKNNELANMVFGKRVNQLTEAQKRRYYSNNDKAREAFTKRKEQGLSLSDRVWQYTDQFKEEIEMSLDIGIREGHSAAKMNRDLRQYLNKPDMLFRRVRNEHGQLELSKRAKAYHPGQGVYRSSYKNARRLAVTETNMAYRTADNLRYQKMDFVVGIEIHLSGNHTLNGEPFHDICDELAGKYPKDFKFTGWHPQCRCFVTSILKTREEREEDVKKILRGEPVDGESVNNVKDVPRQLNEWLKNNEQRVKYHTSIPYFLKDNPTYIPKSFIDNIGTLKRVNDAGIINDIRDAVIKLKDPTYITDKEVRTIISDFAAQNPTLFNGGFNGVKVTKAKDVDYMMANERSYIRSTGEYDNKGNTIKIANKDILTNSGEVFNPLQELKGAIRAIVEKREFTFNEEYAIESLWHEIRHASAKGWNNIANITEGRVVVMETINQFCARRSYGQFVKALGGKTSNQNDIINNGYGYNSWVNNFGKILKHCNISPTSAYIYFKGRIVNTPYEDIEEDVTEFLVDRGGIKRETAATLLKGLRLSESSFDYTIKGV